LPGCIRLRNDLYCVEWGVKLYSLTSDILLAIDAWDLSALVLLDLSARAVRRRAVAADILLTPPSPIVTDRRAAAADSMSASRRRRFRGVINVMSYTSYYVA